MSIRQGTDDWLAARRSSVSSTDLAAILGLSPYRSEADLADEKRGTMARSESTLPMRVGLALEPLIKDEYERQTGERLRRVRTLQRHPRIPWAVASPDYAVVGRHKLVEAKWTTSRRWNDGLPQDVESQVVWCLGVMGWRDADVAALIGGRELAVFHVEYDDDTFAGLVDIATDFRHRWARRPCSSARRSGSRGSGRRIRRSRTGRTWPMDSCGNCPRRIATRSSG
jgi:putative phage-type endonuclease